MSSTPFTVTANINELCKFTGMVCVPTRIMRYKGHALYKPGDISSIEIMKQIFFEDFNGEVTLTTRINNDYIEYYLNFIDKKSFKKLILTNKTVLRLTQADNDESS